MYRYRHAQEYPEDFLHYSGLRYGELIAGFEAGIYGGVVAEMPGANGAAGTSVVGFGFWELSGDAEEKRERHGSWLVV